MTINRGVGNVPSVPGSLYLGVLASSGPYALGGGGAAASPGTMEGTKQWGEELLGHLQSQSSLFVTP